MLLTELDTEPLISWLLAFPAPRHHPARSAFTHLSALPACSLCAIAPRGIGSYISWTERSPGCPQPCGEHPLHRRWMAALFTTPHHTDGHLSSSGNNREGHALIHHAALAKALTGPAHLRACGETSCGQESGIGPSGHSYATRHRQQGTKRD